MSKADPGQSESRHGTVKLYRDDSVTPVVYEDVKHVFMTADNTVLTIAQITDTATGAHRYVHWPRERWCWYVYDKPTARCGGTTLVPPMQPCPGCGDCETP